MEQLGLLADTHQPPSLVRERKWKTISKKSNLKLQVSCRCWQNKPPPSHPLNITSCNLQEIFTCCLVYLMKGKKRKHVIDMQFATQLRRGSQSKWYTPQCIGFPCDACVSAVLDLYALHLQTWREPPHSSCLGHWGRVQHLPCKI